GVGGSWGAMGRRALDYLVEWVGVLAGDHVALPVLLVVGAVVLRRSRLRWLIPALVLHPIAMALLAPYHGPAFQTGRYTTHLASIEVVVGIAGLGALLSALPAWPGLRAAAVGPAALTPRLPPRPPSRRPPRGRP